MAAEKKKASPKKVSAPKTARKSAAKSSKSVEKPKRQKPVEMVDPVAVSPAENKAIPMTEKDLEFFRQLLLEKRHELLGDVDFMGGGAFDGNRQESTGELSNMPIHMADVGTDNFEQEFTLGLIESDRKILRDIDLALRKIQDGTYGICEGTGEPISRSRLEAVPHARYCIEYAKLMEKGKVRPAESSSRNYDTSDDEDDVKQVG